MKPARTLIVSAIFVLIAVVVAVWLYPRLPVRVPIRWNAEGQASAYASSFWGAAMPALAILALAVLTVVLPAISPRRFAITPFAAIYGIVMLAIQGAILVIGMASLLGSAGYALPVPTIVMLAVGALLMVLGNYLGKLRKNFFIGIRTPWTLSSDAVWERTHRLGGRLFVLAGAVIVIATLAGAAPWVAIAAIVAAGLIPAAYSLWIYRSIGRSAD